MLLFARVTIMKRVIFVVFVLLYFSTVCETVRNVRLIDHRSYIISLVQRTVNRVEELSWSNLKISDISIDINEDIFGIQYEGTLEFKNGFVLSIQSMDVIEHTIQQMWISNDDNTTSAQPQATLRLNNVAVGFDVTAHLLNEVHHFTGVLVYPVIQLQFLIAKNIYTDVITARVIGTVTTHNNRMRMLPYNHISKAIPHLFNWNSIVDSVIDWGDAVFAPVALDVALHELKFPTICYNCAT